MAEPRIVVFDIETLPILSEVLKVWPGLSNYPGLTLKASHNSIICAGWKVVGEKKVNCIDAWDFPAWEKDVNNDKALCKALYDVLMGADAVITQNGKRFDWKFLQTRLMIHGLPPLPKTPHIDTKQEAKKHLMMFNNRLGTLGQHLCGDDKLENGGWNLWVDVHARKKKAMQLMTKYCKQDVVLTEKVFLELRPLISTIPNFNIFCPEYAGGKRVCPMCGSTRLKSQGWRHTKTRSYKRLRCLDCQGFSATNAQGHVPRSL